MPARRTPKTPLLKYYNCYTWRLQLHDWVAVLIKYLPFSVWSHHPSHNYYCQIFQKCLVWLYVCRLFSPLHIHILRAKKAIPRNVCGECYFKYFTQWKPTIITRRRCEGDGCKGGGGYQGEVQGGGGRSQGAWQEISAPLPSSHPPTWLWVGCSGKQMFSYFHNNASNLISLVFD